ncbi:CATRA system-associated protein [Streptomyces sp. NPDC096142]|uniref:CATRA system-associated protein n=1 Tax=Streptomyces sp. NPDC096142 TaxID=3366077 RepID=UPI0037F56DD9
MSTSEGAAVIDRETADAARLALELMLDEWRLTPEGWGELAELLAELTAAVAAGDASGVKALTGELDEWSGGRVGRITDAGDGTELAEDRRVPLPEPDRERVVALVHALAPDAPPGGPASAPARRT